MHGWGANAALMLPAVPPLHAAGFAVLLPDARCHGASDDEEFSSMPRFAEDIGTGLDWLRGQTAVDATRLAVVGHSVGAAAALLAATQREDIRAVVSLSAFAHPAELMRRWLHEQHLPWWPLGLAVAHHVQRVLCARFDDIAPLATLPRVRCPVLLVHGLHDETAPFADAQRLEAASAGRAPVLPVDAGHDLGGRWARMRMPSSASCARRCSRGRRSPSMRPKGAPPTPLEFGAAPPWALRSASHRHGTCCRPRQAPGPPSDGICRLPTKPRHCVSCWPTTVRSASA